jgi:hypothetical protein
MHGPAPTNFIPADSVGNYNQPAGIGHRPIHPQMGFRGQASVMETTSARGKYTNVNSETISISSTY